MFSFSFISTIKENNFTATLLKRNGELFDFAALPIHQYGAAVESETFGSFSELLDHFYEAKEKQERVRQRGADLIRTATNARDRGRRKLAIQEKDYAATQERGRPAAEGRPDHCQPLPDGAGTEQTGLRKITTMSSRRRSQFPWIRY